MYIVVSGRARFVLDEDEIDAPAGTIVFIRDPAVQREAIAEEPGTLVLAVGGKPGPAYEPSAWETMFYAIPASREGRWDDAIALHEEALARAPGQRALLYNLACMESRGGRHAGCAPAPAAGGRRSSSAGRPHAQTDTDFDAIRGEPGLPDAALAAAGQASALPASSRSAGTGSASGRATTSTAPNSSSGVSESTSSCRPTASANALCDWSPPNGTSSSIDARPAITSP